MYTNDHFPGYNNHARKGAHIRLEVEYSRAHRSLKELHITVIPTFQSFTVHREPSEVPFSSFDSPCS